MAEVCVGLSFGRRFAGLQDSTKPAASASSSCAAECWPAIASRSATPTAWSLGERESRTAVRQRAERHAGLFRQPEDSARVLRDGWLDTGDLGYWSDGEIVITGRAKDLIIVNGRNIWPQDIEWAVEALPRLRRGDACAFSVDGERGEEVVVLVQAVADDGRRARRSDGNIRQTVRETAGIDCRVELISRRIGLPLTSSGKLSRSRAKARLLAGGYDRTSLPQPS